MFFTPAFITEIKKETIAINNFCDGLNKDDVFIEKINTLVDSPNSNGVQFRAQQFFISDLIFISGKMLERETEKSRFTLAYYYDVLRNNRFADETNVNGLNKLVATDDFNLHLTKIKQENQILLSEKKETCLLLAALPENDKRTATIVNYYQRFLNHAYGIKAESDKKFRAFLNLPKLSLPNTNQDVSGVPEGDTLEKVLEELHALIGLKEIKNNVGELINLLKIQKKRSDEGLKNVDLTLHAVFLGPPGTGKTTVARLLGRIYKHLGFLTKGQLYETDREGMIAGYVGQTAAKVDKVVDESIGGVLFIDEAYSLTQNAMGNDYGAEAINILLKRMEDYRDDLAVVVAGYDEPMKIFIESNPGLRSRFNRFFKFDHFTPAELYLIFESICKESDFIISEDASEKLNDTFNLLYEKKDEGFGNARTVRNLFQKCVQIQANRIIKLPKLNHKVLKTLTEADIPEPKDTLKQVYFSIEAGNK
jgi:SpoVK/Ycf46/Vps4 family AAA+-type ATPase